MNRVRDRAKALAGAPGRVPMARLLAVLLLAALLPATHGWRSARALEAAREEALLGWIDREATRVRAAAPAHGPASDDPRDGSLLARISALAAQHDLAISRSNDEASGAVTIALAAARTDRALLWLEELETGLGLRIEHIVISRAAAPGVANLQLRARVP